MHIELIGCTSSGKSTLIAGILQSAAGRDGRTLSGDEFVLACFRLGWVKGHLPRTLLVDFISLLSCALHWKHVRYYSLAVGHLLRQPLGLLEKLNLIRNSVKKVGIYELIRRRAGDQVVVVDEGTLHAAHNLYVHSKDAYSNPDLSEFVRLVPKPDVVVYVKQKQEVLVDRVVNRGHRRVPDGSREHAARFVNRAVATFDELVANTEIREKLLLVEDNRLVGPESSGDAALDRASALIREGIAASAGVTHLPPADETKSSKDASVGRDGNKATSKLLRGTQSLR